MRYFVLIDLSNGAAAPSWFAGLPLPKEQTVLLNAGSSVRQGWDYADTQQLWGCFFQASQRATDLNCQVVLYAPAAALAADRRVDLSVACELAIRGYFALLPSGHTQAAWRVQLGTPLHAYGHKITILAPASALPNGVGIDSLLAVAANAWSQLPLPNLQSPLTTLPWAWLSVMPERLALAKW